ncbi:MAG TPA: N-ethylammeline chlorohydrolase [Firmicutes bacterium]|nr:N-ethylammeline chlorohydrolase [Bacillota bacterium]
MPKILIRPGFILSGGDNWEVIRDNEILVEDGIIVYIGRRRDYVVGEIDRIIDGKNQLVMPGLINTHTHAAMALFRSFADDMPLMEWLEKKIWPAEERLKKEDIYWGTMLAISEMIRGGTTCFADMYFHMDDVARACLESGIRASLAQGLIGIDSEKGTAGLKQSKSLISSWHRAGEGRLTIMLGPHAPYTCPPRYLQDVMSIAADLKVPLHIHLAETRDEVRECLEKWGKRPVELMDSIGLFAHRVLAAHCVHLSEREIKILAEKQVFIAHNPGSNLKLGSGIAPLMNLLAAGAHVSLGTDGAASNNNLDMLEELRLAALLAKGFHEDPTVIPARKALQLATTNGAQALFLEAGLGTLTEEAPADLIMLDLLKPHLNPHHDLCAHLVYAASAADVELVMVKGKLLMEKRELLTIDEEMVLYEANRRAERLTR